jgi:hypothetical protein
MNTILNHLFPYVKTHIAGPYLRGEQPLVLSTLTAGKKFPLALMGVLANRLRTLDLGQLFIIPPFSAQKAHSAGGRRGPRIFCFVWNPNIFVT